MLPMSTRETSTFKRLSRVADFNHFKSRIWSNMWYVYALFCHDPMLWLPFFVPIEGSRDVARWKISCSRRDRWTGEESERPLKLPAWTMLNRTRIDCFARLSFTWTALDHYAGSFDRSDGCDILLRLLIGSLCSAQFCSNFLDEISLYSFLVYLYYTGGLSDDS